MSAGSRTRATADLEVSAARRRLWRHGRPSTRVAHAPLLTGGPPSRGFDLDSLPSKSQQTTQLSLTGPLRKSAHLFGVFPNVHFYATCAVIILKCAFVAESLYSFKLKSNKIYTRIMHSRAFLCPKMRLWPGRCGGLKRPEPL